MRVLRPAAQFKRDLKKAGKQGRNIDVLQGVVVALQQGRALDEKYRDHALTGNWRDHCECHLGPDWLLIYKVTETELRLARLGSHGELFG